MKGRKRFFLKAVSLFLAFNLLLDVFFPTMVWALTSGPASPDFSSFEPVATTDMVNVFSGDLTYNLPVLSIPGPDGGGYALSLSNHSGSNVEEEASWVGFGWTLNPGAINRNVRGFPDDYKGAVMKQYNKNWPNWSVTAHDQVSLEFFSKSDIQMAKEKEESPVSSFPSVSLEQSLRYNNYQGFNRTLGVGVGYKGSLSLNTQFNASGVTFSASISVATILNKLIKKLRQKAADKKDKADDSSKKTKKRATTKKAEPNKTSAFLNNSLKRNFGKIKQGLMSNGNLSTYGLSAFESFGMASSMAEHKGYGMNFNTSVGIHPSQAPVGIEIGMGGSFQMQYNQPVVEINTYGYMNNLNRGDYKDEQDANKMSDYFIEKESTFDQRDLFIGIPHPNYDIFSLSGEGLSGGFRLFNVDAGHYYPNFVASNITELNTGVEFAAGLNLDIGLNFGVGNTKLRVKDWGNQGNTTDIQYDKTASPVFRFNHDGGGEVKYSGNADVQTANLIVNPNFPAIKSAYPEISNIYPHVNNASDKEAADRAIGRSSYIQKIMNGDKFAGFEIFKEDGSRYKYGQAVYAKNEISVGVDVKPGSNEIVDNKTVYKSTPLSSNGFDEGSMNQFHTVVGSAKVGNDANYATSFLITEITTTDYVDANGNGQLDDADFGGWTKFEYEKIHDDYRWKVPYTGMNYEVNDISREKDDMGHVSTGEKEVYYLRRIKTKTHTAYFITNKNNGGYINPAIQPSGIDRKDGLSANLLTDSKTVKGAHKLENLEKIVLVSNARTDKPVKVVNFKYTNELIPNLPNNIDGNYPGNTAVPNSGKLTLKKVWFEYEGVTNARISPYEFYYRYKDKYDFSSDIQSKYPQLAGFFNLSNIYSDAAQNPSYSPYIIDAWGYTQPYGQQQNSKMRDWHYQGALAPGTPYDPAAFQLKQIKLPSGGEILVEYEEKDYRYVQDRDVMALVSLIDFDDDKAGLLGNNTYSKSPWYKINLDDIGVTDILVKQAIVAKMNEYFIDQGNRIFFKYLFELTSDDIPSLSDCRSEYVHGYAKVKSVALESDGNIKITIDGADSKYENYAMTPRQACYDFYSTQRVGKYQSAGSGCEAGFDSKDSDVESLAYREGTMAGDVITYLKKLGFAIETMVELHGKILDFSVNPPLKSTVCRQMNKELSYLKIPMCKPKKGGGCRVKRLLTLDPGIESGDAGAIYGSVYHYQEADGLSSGIATNEPTEMREENPLVTFLPKGIQSWFSRHTVGKDKEQTEGPIGEALLPPASIGHSRVVIENIHQGKSGDGFAIHTFFTVKDYAFDKGYSYTQKSESGVTEIMPHHDFAYAGGVEYSRLKDNTAKDKAGINAGIFAYHSKKFWYTQGFRFIQNNMHGQPKSLEKYSGTYATYQTNPDKVFLAFAQAYEYFEPGEQMRVLKKNDVTNGVDVIWTSPGKEMDMAMESKSVKERSLSFLIEVDISIGLMVPPPPFITLSPSFEFAENISSSHATSKVVNYPAIQKAVKVYQDGIWSRSENLAFDIATGQPLLTSATDIYDQTGSVCEPHDGSIYNMLIPAHWYYQEMRQKAEASYLSIYRTNQVRASAGTFISYGKDGNPIKSGDHFEIPISSILDAKIQTFSQGNQQTGWFDGQVISDFGISSAALTSLNNIYRPFEQYVFKTPVTSINANLVQDAGVYTGFVPYDFASAVQAPGWIRTNEVVKYSPQGMPVEEKDVLGIPSAAKFGYGFNLPVIVGSNCEYSTLSFEDYENSGTATSSYAHSGERSMRFSSSPQVLLPSIELTSRLKQKGAILRLWLKSDQVLNNSLKAKVAGTLTADAKKIAQTGDWSLYHFDFPSEQLSALSVPTVTVSLEYNMGGNQIYLDDVKFQPKDAQVSCFVYDVKTLRLLTQFDDQHFGMYYQYNDEGKLVRKLIETEKGLKTIQETQYNTPKVYRLP